MFRVCDKVIKVKERTNGGPLITGTIAESRGRQYFVVWDNGTASYHCSDELRLYREPVKQPFVKVMR